MVFDVSWMGGGCVCVEDDGFSVVVDPVSCVDVEADLVLVTGKGFDSEVLEDLNGGRTVFVFPGSVGDVSFRDVEFLGPGEMIDVYGVEIEAVPAYDGGLRGVGYRFSMGGMSFYVAGETGFVDDMRDLENRVDMAFLPVGGVMGVEDAVRAGVSIKPDLVVPYRFDEVGKDVRRVEAELEDRSIDCRVVEPGSEV
ncbi:MAG: MBL fold metallo-hydrolase [Candidatus Nanohalobium sp.]